jgi:uncharacterized coiled-coil protein SlyX
MTDIATRYMRLVERRPEASPRPTMPHAATATDEEVEIERVAEVIHFAGTSHEPLVRKRGACPTRAKTPEDVGRRIASRVASAVSAQAVTDLVDDIAAAIRDASKEDKMGSDGPNMQADLLAQLEQQLAAANARVAELETRAERQSKTISNFYDAIKNVGGDPCEFSKAIYKLGDTIKQLESTLAACREAGFVTDGGRPIHIPKRCTPTRHDVDYLAEFVEWHGAVHLHGCPEDDTCGCGGRPVNEATNKCLLFLKHFAGGQTREVAEACGATFATASGETVTPCHKPDAVWTSDEKHSSEEEEYHKWKAAEAARGGEGR